MSDSPAVLELRFPRARLNDAAGDPYWIDLTVDEARKLHAELAQRLALAPETGDSPLAFSIG